MQGLRYAWRNELSFRMELVLSLFLIPLAFIISDQKIELFFLISSIFGVLVTELLNTALEALADRFSDEHHMLTGAAKDAGSAAVFMSLIFAAFIWIYLLIEYFFTIPLVS
jgi:diacylglycerol kinase (ATP)